MIKPLPGYVLIEPIEDEQKTASGLYKPDTSKDKPSKGKIIAVGSNEERLQESLDVSVKHSIFRTIKVCPVKEGNIVIYKKWTNQEVEHKGKKYLLVKFDELLGVIE